MLKTIDFRQTASTKIEIGQRNVYKSNGHIVGFDADDRACRFRFVHNWGENVKVEMSREAALRYARAVVKALEFDAEGE